MKTFATKASGKQRRGRVATAASGATPEDVGSYWIGRVQKLQRKVGSKWGMM